MRRAFLLYLLLCLLLVGCSNPTEYTIEYWDYGIGKPKTILADEVKWIANNCVRFTRLHRKDVVLCNVRTVESYTKPTTYLEELGVK
jgi:hypothetical protein